MSEADWQFRSIRSRGTAASPARARRRAAAAAAAATVLAGSAGLTLALFDRGPELPQPHIETRVAPNAPAPAGAAESAAVLPEAAALPARTASAAQPGLAAPDGRADLTLAARRPRITQGAPARIPPARAAALADRADTPPQARQARAPRPRPEGLAIPDSVPAAAPANAAIASAPAPRPRPVGATPLRLAHAETAAPAAARSGAGPLTGRSRAATDTPCSPRLAGAIPARAGDAPAGSVFLAGLTGVGGTTRDARIAAQITAGNVPGFLRDLVPVTFAGARMEITLCVTPDYLALGSDRDHVRVPLGLSAATRVAEEFDMLLPTTRMVDAIYAQADLQLPPRPMAPGAQMASTDYFLRHDATVSEQIRSAGSRAGILVAGQKKDLVLTNRLARSPGRVAIYGWHRPGGQPIQPLSTVHGAGYADYSHGVRLVSRTAFVDGRAVDLGTLLSDGSYAGLLSDEGPITGPAPLLAALSR